MSPIHHPANEVNTKLQGKEFITAQIRAMEAAFGKKPVRMIKGTKPAVAVAVSA